MLKFLKRLHILHDWGAWSFNRTITTINDKKEPVKYETEYIRFCLNDTCYKPQLKTLNGMARKEIVKKISVNYNKAIEVADEILNKASGNKDEAV